jgi:leader peptidase (prepilin peptidase)/N-methyltransferase
MIVELVVVGVLAGLLIGSFLNVCIFRLPRDLSVASPARSFCPYCEKTIAWYDNIPVVSYVVLGGRCRQCQARIPLRYPVVEIATAAAFGLCAAALGPTLAAVKYSLFSAIMIMLIACDIEERILPDEFTLGGTLLGLVFAAFVPLEHYFISVFIPYRAWPGWSSLAESAFGAAVGSGSIWFIGFLYEKIRHREGMGLGDVKMIAMIGAFMGLRVALETLILGSLIGSIVGIIFIKVTKQDAATYELPFGSFLGAAGLFIVLAGNVFSVWFPRLRV